MTYKETLDFLYSSLPAYHRIGKAAYKADLKTSIALDKYFESPHKQYKTVHIAGTNGKGSVSHFISSVLSSAGYRTGLYTSPHIRDFRERIRINGEKIEEKYVVNFVEKHKDFFLDLKPSFFEITVAMAFLYFKEMNVDVAVIETGMGGRLDSTNLVRPLLSVITNISLDHTQFLGSTKGEIAIEKAGIIKSHVPVLIGRTDIETEGVFRSVAREMDSPISFADKRLLIERKESADPGIMQAKIWKGKEVLFEKLLSGLAGDCQLENIVTSLSSLEILRNEFRISDKSILQGYAEVVSTTGIEGRWQVIRKEPLVICDTAHNHDGLSRTINQVLKLPAVNYRFVLGFVNDKNIDAILDLFPEDAEYYLTRASVPRSLSAEDLLGRFELAGLKSRKFDNVKDASDKAISDSVPGDIIYIGGSTFIVADFLEFQE